MMNQQAYGANDYASTALCWQSGEETCFISFIYLKWINMFTDHLIVSVNHSWLIKGNIEWNYHFLFSFLVKLGFWCSISSFKETCTEMGHCEQSCSWQDNKSVVYRAIKEL